MTPTAVLFLGLGALFFAVLLGGGILAFPNTSRREASRSLSAIGGLGGAAQGQAPAVESFADRVLVPFFKACAQLARRFSPDGVNARITRRLDLAGNPAGATVDRQLAYKGAGFVILALLGCYLGRHGVLTLLLFGGGFAAAGFYVPDILLYNTGTKRQQQIQKALPDALDLLTISVEAGLGFDAALGQVARNTQGPLAGELFRVLQEMQIGKTRSDSFRSLSARTSVAELRGFVGAMTQADAFGIPIANVLREQAKEMRLKRQQRAEEKAMKVPVKVLFPLVFFIFPSLFVVIIGPGAISIYHSFTGH